MYKIFDTQEEALSFSHEKAVSMGNGNPNNGFEYWYAIRKTIDGKWAIECPEGTEPEPIWEEIEGEL